MSVCACVWMSEWVYDGTWSTTMTLLFLWQLLYMLKLLQSLSSSIFLCFLFVEISSSSPCLMKEQQQQQYNKNKLLLLLHTLKRCCTSFDVVAILVLILIRKKQTTQNIHTLSQCILTICIYTHTRSHLYADTWNMKNKKREQEEQTEERCIHAKWVRTGAHWGKW